MSGIAKTSAVERRSIERINQSFFGSINPRIVIVRMEISTLYGYDQRESGKSISAGLGTLPALFSFKLMPFPTLLAKTVVIDRGTACKSSWCISKPATELVMKDR